MWWKYAHILFPGELKYSGEELFFLRGELNGGELSFQGGTYFWRAGGEHKKNLCFQPGLRQKQALIYIYTKDWSQWSTECSDLWSQSSTQCFELRVLCASLSSVWNRNFKIFEKAISFIEISVRSFTKFHKISQSFNLRWAEISKENKYKKFNKKFQNSKKPTETSREISWNFDINFTKFQLKFH